MWREERSHGQQSCGASLDYARDDRWSLDYVRFAHYARDDRALPSTTFATLTTLGMTNVYLYCDGIEPRSTRSVVFDGHMCP